MKILFAVSNENVSNKIVDSYQKKYGEAVSFKSVFYFNAIIREIHKDKTYDRIVISEDLEPFSNSNYDVIDKFILERFKEISNEINSQEKFIDVVVICTDRRTKSGYVLSKMYEYGIYNALVGSDRRIDNVCNLLNTPRTAQEAKEYYGLENQVDTSSVDDVSEQEVQNILIHYKKLGKNEDRYVDSFNNIAAQYTDKQLKIIIKCLPINVRAVLEAECPKYQELVTYAEETEEERKQKEKLQEQKRIEQIENERKLKQKIERDKREAERNAQRERQVQQTPVQRPQTPSGIDLLDNKRREQRMTGNVIIPDNMNIRNERKIYSDEELNAMSNRPSQRPARQVEQSANTLPGLDDWDNIPQAQPVEQPASTLPGLDDLDNIQQARPVEQPASTLPGLDDLDNIPQARPVEQPASTLPGLDDLDNIQQARPVEQPASTLPGLDDLDNIPQARPVEQPASTLPGLDDLDNIQQARPVEQPASTLPGLDDLDNIQQTRPVQQPASTLPGLDDLDNIPQTRLVQHPENLIPDVNSDSQMQMEAVASQPEIPQEPKRGRGRPRKNPVEPPKPKGKRGRPRKNPLPEENIEKEKIIPGVNDFENIPKVDKIQQTESTTQPENIRQTDEWNNIESIPEQTNNISKNVDWNNDPFEGKTNQQIANSLPGLDDLAENTQPTTLPGTNDWDRDPFEQSNNVQPANEPSTLPGMNDWDKDPFEQSNNVQPANEPSTLPGMNDWDKDPFEQSNNVQPANEPSTLPGMNDWDNDPFEDLYKEQPIEGAGTLPGTDDWNRDPFETNQTNNSNEPITLSSSVVQPNMNQNNEMDYNKPEPKTEERVSAYQPSQEKIETIKKIEEDKLYTTGSLSTVLTKDKKIVAFVGARKSGTSFLVNNLACLFSSIGVKTAILDMTQNKDAYFIYTNNDENLRNIAHTSIENLEKGIAEGIQIDRNLNVYTALPHDGKDYSNAEAILSTLVQNESLVLIDCDLQTDLGYFANAQEIYLVQSMDILTIQPLTAFLRDLKAKGLLDQEKLRIVINKDIKVKGVTSKDIIGGMSMYNDPAMSYMTDLFNKDKVKACSIPFDETVYTKYLEEVINCVISINRYNKNFMNSLKMLGNMVYPLLSKQTYTSRNSAEANYGNNFSSEMNNTLNQMKNKY